METDWISIAIASAGCLGLVNIFDSHLISRRMPGIRVYLLVVSPIVLLSASIFFFIFPLPQGLSAWQILAAVGTGIIRASSVVILLYSLKKEEVSRAVPIVSIYPVFVAIMAVPLLNETLSYLQWIAIAIVVAGVIIISFKRDTGGIRHKRLGGIFFLLLLSSLLLATADVTGKYVLSYISFWNMYWINITTMVAIFLIISLRRSVIGELLAIKNPRSTLALVFFNEMMVVIATLTMFWSMQQGQVSMVSTITSTRPVFVVIYAFILSRFLPGTLMEGDVGRRELVIRLLAAAMLAGGIAIIYIA